MTTFFNNFKKPIFWSIFHIFGAIKLSPKNFVLSCTTSHEFLAPRQTQKKTKDPIPRKYLARWKKGRMEGRPDSRMDGRTDPILKEPSDY